MEVTTSGLIAMGGSPGPTLPSIQARPSRGKTVQPCRWRSGFTGVDYSDYSIELTLQDQSFAVSLPALFSSFVS